MGPTGGITGLLLGKEASIMQMLYSYSWQRLRTRLAAMILVLQTLYPNFVMITKICLIMPSNC
tara:strand:- start:527 stop:715 length:189 start_codon:yes stop_codon:yes gene_type:complete